MTTGRHGESIIETLGDLVDHGMGLTWYCGACNRNLDLTLDKAIEMWGRGQIYIRWQPRLRCASCGSRDVSKLVHANTRIGPGAGSAYSG